MTEKKQSVESAVKNIRRNSKKKYTAEEKIKRMTLMQRKRVHQEQMAGV